LDAVHLAVAILVDDHRLVPVGVMVPVFVDNDGSIAVAVSIGMDSLRRVVPHRHLLHRREHPEGAHVAERHRGTGSLICEDPLINPISRKSQPGTMVSTNRLYDGGHAVDVAALELPTAVDLGLPGMIVTGSIGLLAPAGTSGLRCPT
jgi:hypothetical protein